LYFTPSSIIFSTLLLMIYRSLVKAADGLHEELYTVLVPFFLAILFFQGASIACNFFMMSFIAASTSSIIMLLGFYYWYIYLERMYNRFQVFFPPFISSDTIETNRFVCYSAIQKRMSRDTLHRDQAPAGVMRMWLTILPPPEGNTHFLSY
jgi:hypothetical protein